MKKNQSLSMTVPNVITTQLPGFRETEMIVKKTLARERKRISGELHDNVNQILTTVKLFMEMLQPSLDQDKKIKTKSIDYVKLAIQEIRKISRELVQQENNDEDLASHIQEIIEDIQFCTPIAVVFNYDKQIENIHPDKKTALLRIVQEQIKNIVSYSHAEKVVIRLDMVAGTVRMEITDNGVGFDSKKATAGIGLHNINERMMPFSGTVNIKTAKGKGCSLLVSLPAA